MPAPMIVPERVKVVAQNFLFIAIFLFGRVYNLIKILGWEFF